MLIDFDYVKVIFVLLIILRNLNWLLYCLKKYRKIYFLFEKENYVYILYINRMYGGLVWC